MTKKTIVKIGYLDKRLLKNKISSCSRSGTNASLSPKREEIFD